MRKFYIAICLVFIVAYSTNSYSHHTSTPGVPESRCTIPKTAISDREKACLRGNVRRVKIESPLLEKRDGQHVKVAVSQTAIFNYDRRGNLVERRIYGSNYYGTAGLSSRVVYNFSANGVATGWEEYSSSTNKLIVRSIYSYDKAGNRIRETVTYLRSNIRAIAIHSYDANGNRIEKNSYYPVPAGNPAETNESIRKYFTWRTEFKFEGAHLIQRSNYKSDGSIIYKGEFKFNKGNRTEVIAHSPNASGVLARSARITFRFDKKGNVIEKIFYNNDDSIKIRYVDGFDKNGFRVSRIIYDSNGRIKDKHTFTYDYDAKGNWLSYESDYLSVSKLRNSSEPLPSQLRTITYF